MYWAMGDIAHYLHSTHASLGIIHMTENQTYRMIICPIVDVHEYIPWIYLAMSWVQYKTSKDHMLHYFKSQLYPNGVDTLQSI